ncbi:alpha/beta hydrolase [Limnohabitans sp. 2KL-1]|uniref:alpha/beta fold hydrolase n=1 Tax=Limnohabitans sp. 2KL-1 TaxID=1100699 RepID=UPI000D36992B|nr:alpha/beta hydrolase [Limnohabitans sp. 2KL-1]PUE50733.1 alpha/beta hydrolase [Limnohabitans sp. 2KL-1]
MIETWQQDLPHGITLSCRACGEPGRPVLMFLHGFPEAAWVWDPLLVHFSKPENGGYRCVAPHLRGYERSSAPEDVKAYRAKYLVQDIVALIALESGQAPLAALVAHDWGGAVAWSLANQHPERLRQLVIVNSPHPGPFLKALQSHPEQQAASAYMNFLVQPDAAAQLAANDFERLLGFLDGHDSALPSLTQPQAAHAHEPARWLTPELKERYRQVWRHGLQGGLNYYRASPLRPATAQDPGASVVQIPPEALHISVPTLVLWAQDDIALLPCLTEGLAQHVPDLKLVPIAKASHWVVHEKPGRVIREITRFLTPPGQ